MNILFCIYELDFADHIALAYLSAVARQRGHEPFLCVLSREPLSAAVRRTSPRVIAYSANIQGATALLAAHGALLAGGQDIFSIMGGPYPTYYPETFDDSGMDAYCVGEGEGAFDDFLAAVEGGRPFDDIPNLITAKGSNPPRDLIRNLDDLPFPDRDLVLANTFLRDTPKKTFYATRGCPFKCKYCCNNYFRKLYKGRGRVVRRFSVDRIIGEIQYVKARYRTDFIKFGDDLFAMKADTWLAEFSQVYGRKIKIPFNCYLRIDAIDDELLARLKEAGCHSVHLSVDSTSEIVREEVLGRQMRPIDIVGTLGKIRDAGIHTWCNFMLAAPESRLKDDLDAIALGRAGRVTYPSFSTTVPLKGTDLYTYCKEHKLIDPVTHKNDMAGCTLPSTLSCFSPRDRAVRYNIYLVGAVIAKLPRPLFDLGLLLIRIVPPNPFFKWIRRRFYKYNIENRIFKLHPS